MNRKLAHKTLIYITILVIFLQGVYFYVQILPKLERDTFRRSDGRLNVLDKNNMYAKFSNEQDLAYIFANNKSSNIETALSVYREYEERSNLSEDEKFFIQHKIFNMHKGNSPQKAIEFATKSASNEKLTDDAKSEAIFLLTELVMNNYKNSELILKHLESIFPYGGLLGQHKSREMKIYALADNSFAIYPGFHNGSLKLLLLSKVYETEKDAVKKERVGKEILGVYETSKEQIFNGISSDFREFNSTNSQFYFIAAYYNLRRLGVLSDTDDQKMLTAVAKSEENLRKFITTYGEENYLKYMKWSKYAYFSKVYFEANSDEEKTILLWSELTKLFPVLTNNSLPSNFLQESYFFEKERSLMVKANII